MEQYKFNSKKFKKFVLNGLGYIIIMSVFFMMSLYILTHLDTFTTISAYQEVGQALREYWLF